MRRSCSISRREMSPKKLLVSSRLRVVSSWFVCMRPFKLMTAAKISAFVG